MPMIAQAPAKLVALPKTIVKAVTPGQKHFIPKWAFWLGVAILLAASGSYWRFRTDSKISFETVPLERGSIQPNITATGTLNPVVNVQVSSQV